MQPATACRRLFSWHDPAARGLPWRTTRDPWAVLVSEVMLQQTQAARVIPAWRRFVQVFPTVTAAATAPRAAVVTAWEGLGYHRRAVNLHRSAIQIVSRHDGQVPADLRALVALPGVGDYTARAVLAFAFGHDAAPVDTNVARVLTRAIAGRPLGRAATQAVADAAVPAGRGPQWAAALMDLGALVCTARSPRCSSCPLRSGCAWRDHGGPDPAAAGAHRPRPQGSFEGSDRQRRGRVLGALRAGPVPRTGLLALAGHRADAVCAGLIRDGLAAWDGDLLVLAS